MTAHSIASKFRRALRNQTGVLLTADELQELREFGVLIPFGITPVGYVAPPKPITGRWPQEEVVYFVGAAEGPVKIGYASDLRARFRHLRYMSPSPLHVWAFARGSMELEKSYHRQFAFCRLHGEWFDRTESLVAEMARLNEVEFA